MKIAVRSSLLFAVLLLLPQCASDHAGAPLASRAAPAAEGAAYKAQERPGLGTQLGHELHDSTRPASFFKAAHGQPDAVATFHYNDDEGAKLMAAQLGRATRRGGSFELAPGRLRARVVTAGWQSATLPHYRAGGKVFVAGQPGDRYEIHFENTGKERVMLVVSVDGLDVLSGRPASTRNPGYVVEPGATLVVNGMKSGGKLRSLLFASVAESQAATAFGERGARNVGVIGTALFVEDAQARRRALLSEDAIRGGASAFASGL